MPCPCYDFELFDEIAADLAKLQAAGRGRAVARVMKKLHRVAVKCKTGNEFPVKITSGGTWLFARSEISGVVGVFVLVDAQPRLPGTVAKMQLVSLNGSAMKAFRDAIQRV